MALLIACKFEVTDNDRVFGAVVYFEREPSFCQAPKLPSVKQLLRLLFCET